MISRSSLANLKDGNVLLILLKFLPRNFVVAEKHQICTGVIFAVLLKRNVVAVVQCDVSSKELMTGLVESSVSEPLPPFVA